MRFFNFTLMAASALFWGDAFAASKPSSKPSTSSADAAEKPKEIRICSATITNMKTGADLGRGSVPYTQPHYIAGFEVCQIWNGSTVSYWVGGPVLMDLAPRGDLRCIQYT
ncbi:uncharacterized protein PgNI_11526 [Pyricularia grisea]|uniref:Uncharacterized protein n=1 Tax=Pyricularia grisea TaxID=148305 RepID=A0A6P8ANN7_PYRGI|nr:uncharacterized protein PgNI_11526 [Pyricularia grisea]TLD03645.1 hypothetical protein PgNI_11526 [Pyricularia grisea]